VPSSEQDGALPVLPASTYSRSVTDEGQRQAVPAVFLHFLNIISLAVAEDRTEPTGDAWGVGAVGSSPEGC